MPGEGRREIREREVGADHSPAVIEPAGKGQTHLSGGEEHVEVRGDLTFAPDRQPVPLALPGVEVGRLVGSRLHEPERVVEEEHGLHRPTVDALDALHRKPAAGWGFQ